MKKLATLIPTAVVAGLALAFAFSVAAQPQQVTAKVTRINGSARYSTDAANWMPLKVGMELGSGTVIQTAAGSIVDLVLGDLDVVAQPTPKVGDTLSYQPMAEQDALRLYGDTVLALDKMTALKTGMDEVRETQLDLRAGKLFGKVKKLSPASKYEVKLPNGVAGIRGTIYSITAQGIVSVLEGTVVLAYVGADGTVVTQVINAGYQFNVGTGQLIPLPAIEQRELASAAGEIVAVPGLISEPTVITVDQNQYFISPVSD
ncbi:MAG TPA: FecR family protein [Verrucomicrobiota bacterium]|nr:FecR family protein [Verrucomicrobiota bacterium]HQB17380.1 FecR family protein [Verrucomicrobiota bacterium]